MIESSNKHLTHFNFISEKQAAVLKSPPEKSCPNESAYYFTQICVDVAFITLEGDFVTQNLQKRKIIYGITGSPSSKYEHWRTSALLRNIDFEM